jgi:hypothetical protein
MTETTDVAWTIVVRIEDTDRWIDWSTGHRTVPDVLAAAELIVPVSTIAEIRFDRITTARERFSLADLGATDAAAPSVPADRAAAAPVKQRADLTEAEWAEQERARFERLYTREYTRAEQAEDLLKVAHETSNRAEAERARAAERAETAKRDVQIYRERLERLGEGYTEQRKRAEAMERAMESTATDALAHRGCHRDLMGQCLRAEKAEAAVERVRSVLESEAVVGRSALDYRGLITAALMADQAPAPDPSRVAGEAQQPETPTFVCKCPAEICHCGHHAAVSQPGKEA